MNPNNYFNAPTDNAYDMSVTQMNAVMRNVYLKMTLGLVLSAIVAFVAASSGAVIEFFMAHHSSMFVLLLLEVGLVIAISSGINKLSSAMATALFFLFAVVNGLALFPIFLAYTDVQIYKTFFVTAGVFGAMTVYGAFTTRDLTRMGTFLVMALFALIIVSVVNIFVGSSAMEFLVTVGGVLIFIGLTAWDTQHIKQMALMTPEPMLGKVATIGALNLYLDFINLFIYLLRLLNNRN